MTLTFLCHVTDTGAAFARMARDVAALARPGDVVVLLDTGSGDDTPAQIARFSGWPAQVTVTVSANTPRLTTDWAVAVAGSAGLNRAAFVSARHEARPGIDHVYQSLTSGFHVIARTSALDGAHWPDDWPALWQLHQTAGIAAPQPFSPAPLPALTRDDLDALARLPDPAWAQAVITAHLDSAGPGPLAVVSQDPHGFTLPAPRLHRAAPLTVCLQGDHAHRTPLSYPHLAPLWADHIRLTDAPDRADLVIWAHPRDLTGASPTAARARNHVLLSEEPFWDTLFSPDPLAPRITLPAPHVGLVRLHQRNHHTSPIFAHDRLPYYLLTQPGFIPAYQRLFQRNQAISAADWARDFTRRTTDIAFMAERRPEDFHDFAMDAGDIVGLCAWRTRLAQDAPGVVQRLGASWQGGATRFTLTDWHADKLAQMDMGPRILSGIENTHQPAYLSEKLFDAFACGTRPLYFASPCHRVHDLGLEAESWINLHGMTSEAAAQALADLSWDAAFPAAFAQAQQTLATLFSDDAILRAERQRLGAAILSDLALCADLGPA